MGCHAVTFNSMLSVIAKSEPLDMKLAQCIFNEAKRLKLADEDLTKRSTYREAADGG